MQYHVNPQVDCVFKALLGAEENRNLLVHFLNAILETELYQPITNVDILNPYNEREFINDKLSIIDVKARDACNQIYQIEIQMLNHRYLPARILYTWADIYTKQLQSGDDYRLLKPTYAIWLLAENLLQTNTDYFHAYKIRDVQGQTLLDHGGIWLLELEKFATIQVETEQQRWLQFFKQAEQLDDTTLPGWMCTTEMRQAMTTLRQFSEKERNYHLYQARQNYLRQQRAIQEELKEEREGKLAALQAKEAAMQEKEAAILRESQAMQEKEAAILRESQAMQEKEAAILRESQAMQAKEAAILRESQAMQGENHALAEIERLKAKLAAIEKGI